jgi:hypothetical protein
LSQECDALTHSCANSCGDHKVDGNESDVDCGGGTCLACADGRHCNFNSDCQSGACSGHICGNYNCADGISDDGEGDIDCGGPCPDRCGLGKHCNTMYDCASNACNMVAQLCVASDCIDGIKNGDETAVDCGGSCMPCPNASACVIDADCASGACDAEKLRCVTNRCADHRKDGAETDVDCGGGTCAPCAQSLHCVVNSDCADAAICDPTSSLCFPATCIDGVLDGNETAVDCGGSCVPCDGPQPCLADQDCVSKACDGLSLTCVDDQCHDHRKEVYEADVDCAGPCTLLCDLGQTCRSELDCLSHACDYSTHTCHVPWCTDGVKDYSESDVDCGGNCPRCGVGEGCISNGDCASFACDGISGTCATDQCVDHQQDGDETWTDCGGPTCPQRCALDERCKVSADCAVGLTCSGGFCLN